MLAVCLRSVQDTIRETSYELIVVDDASTDDTAGMVRERFPEATVIGNPRPASWTVTNNQGVRLGRGRFYLLLNDDTKVLPGAIARCLDFMSQRPRAGIVSPRILNADGSLQPSVRRFPDFGAAIAQALELHRLLPRNRVTGRYYTTDLDYGQNILADDIGSTCWLLRRECYEDVGPFDERFPPNFSDIEYNMRLAKAGWERWVLADAEIIHYGGATMGTLNLRQLWDFHRGGYLLYRKHYAPRHHPVVNFLAYGGLGARFCFKAALRVSGMDRVLQRLPQPHRKRELE
jgi:GT2 family glycosyltransferase